jgi:L-ribulose-5-phosphate 3-epimerase
MISSKIGIMQGRLSRPINNRIQAYPAETWRKEFEIASEIGLHSIEWIVEDPLHQNALINQQNREEVKQVIKDSKVIVEFICADIFMERPMFDFLSNPIDQSSLLIQEIAKAAKEIGAGCVEIPFVDKSSLNNSEKLINAVEVLSLCLPYIADMDMQLALETDLNPRDQVELVERINYQNLKLNYDIGNSASLGYNPVEELMAYGELIANVHIKDRIIGGTTVPLGTGSADIPLVLHHLNKIGYQGNFILQAARGDDDCKVAKNYLAQVLDWIKIVNSD